VSRPLVAGHLHETGPLDEDGQVTPLTTRRRGCARALARTSSSRTVVISSAARRRRPTCGRRHAARPCSCWCPATGLAASRLRVLPELFPRLPLGGLVDGGARVPTSCSSCRWCPPARSTRSRCSLPRSAIAATHREFVLSDQLFWFDGERWTPIPWNSTAREDITVLPPPAFVARDAQAPRRWTSSRSRERPRAG
jgi:hypothetical protein